MTEGEAQPARDHRVVLTSIGRAGAPIVGALKKIFETSEQLLAARLFQAPSVLFDHVPRELADPAVVALNNAGLQCEVRNVDEPFTPGGADHEVALVVHDQARMGAVLQAVMDLLGVDAAEARQIVCASPTVLMGRISAATAEVIARRFAVLGAEVDTSRPAEARYDLFLGDAPPLQRQRVAALLAAHDIAPLTDEDGAPQVLAAAGLPFGAAERLWAALRRANLPGVLVNRDFERFDLVLEAAPDDPQVAALLVETAGMPARVVPRVLSRLPLVTHQNIRFADLSRLLEQIAALGGRARGHLLAFQTFSLTIESVGSSEASQHLLRALAGLHPEEAAQALARRRVEGPLTSPAARWLQHELKQVGTGCRLELR